MPRLETGRIRAEIIEVASQEFEANGYRGTHVMTIIQKMGINPHIFYRHFPSKFDLLLECFKASAPLPLDGAPQDIVDDSEVGENVVRGLSSESRWTHLSGALTEAIRAESPLPPETARHVAQVWDAIIINVLRDFERARKPGAAASAGLGGAAGLQHVRRLPQHHHAGVLGRQVLRRRPHEGPTLSCSSRSLPP